MLGGTGAMTVADGLRNVPRRRTSWKRFLHALVFLSLIGLQVHHAFELGPRDQFDAGWYTGYALSVLHESQLPRGRVEIVPLYPLWLTMWMRIDPDYRGYLQCLHFNLPYWSGGKVVRDGDTSLCADTWTTPDSTYRCFWAPSASGWYGLRAGLRPGVRWSPT